MSMYMYMYIDIMCTLYMSRGLCCVALPFLLLSIYTKMYAHVHACTHVHVHACTHVHIYMYIVYIMCIHVHVHVYIGTFCNSV